MRCMGRFLHHLALPPASAQEPAEDDGQPPEEAGRFALCSVAGPRLSTGHRPRVPPTQRMGASAVPASCEQSVARVPIYQRMCGRLRTGSCWQPVRLPQLHLRHYITFHASCSARLRTACSGKIGTSQQRRRDPSMDGTHVCDMSIFVEPGQRRAAACSRQAPQGPRLAMCIRLRPCILMYAAGHPEQARQEGRETRSGIPGRGGSPACARRGPAQGQD